MACCQTEIKRASLSGQRIHPNFATVVVHHAATNRQSDACACVLVLPVQAFEHLENTFVVFLLGANAVVFYGYHPLTGLPGRRDSNDRRTTLAVLERVADEVEQQLHQLGTRAVDGGQLSDLYRRTGFGDDSVQQVDHVNGLHPLQ